MKNSCSKCKWGKRNIFRNYECWRFNQEKETGDYKNTIDREMKAYNLNNDYTCTYFEKWQLMESLHTIFEKSQKSNKEENQSPTPLDPPDLL